ncbi:MAG: molybdopterin-guanine dinucleotide biosynthesis protein B [Coriobacteriia bacterium]|nr:molybdopterin-guanine dinucleotide biosynthesis protein B [Coriobacteriia bacterium]
MENTRTVPIVSLVGRSNSGKTTFIEKLVGILQEKGYRVACVKQHHRDVPVDVVGKDSWRYAQAGAACSVMATPTQLSLVHRTETTTPLEEIAQIVADAGCDIVLAESFAPVDTVDRYVVARVERIEEPLLRPQDSAGLITDDAELASAWERADRATFDLNDVEKFAKYVIEHYRIA